MTRDPRDPFTFADPFDRRPADHLSALLASRADNWSVGHGLNGSANVNGSRGSRVIKCNLIVTSQFARLGVQTHSTVCRKTEMNF